jgi:hypothetical protein
MFERRAEALMAFSTATADKRQFKRSCTWVHHTLFSSPVFFSLYFFISVLLYSLFCLLGAIVDMEFYEAFSWLYDIICMCVVKFKGRSAKGLTC